MSRCVIWVERNGLTKFGDGFGISLQLGIGNAKVEVGQGVGGFCGDNLFEQRNGRGVIFAIERVLSLGEERSERVCFFVASDLRQEDCWGFVRSTVGRGRAAASAANFAGRESERASCLVTARRDNR